MEALANLAHELRSPMQAILGYLDILRDELGADTSARHAQIVERLSSNAFDLAQTVENVMDFSVADSMAESPHEEEIHLRELIGEVMPALEAANRAKHLALSFDLDNAPACFRSRRRPIKAILLNLILNAIKFTGHGYVAVAIRQAASPAGIEIEVSDSGPGIRPELVAEAFRPCIQLSRSSTRKHRGIGLGLAVVKRNVEALGGQIEVTTSPNRGSSFVVTVPVDRDSNRSAVMTHQAYDDAANRELAFAHHDRLHGRVRRLQANLPA